MQETILECEDYPGETITVRFEGFDETRDTLTTLVANTSVRFVLRRDAGHGGYIGTIEARAYFYDPPPVKRSRAPRKLAGDR
jgi:hypothetical protein